MFVKYTQSNVRRLSLIKSFRPQIPQGMQAVLKAKLPNATVQRKVVLEGARIGAPEALATGIVDDLGADGDDVVQKALTLAGQVSPLAKAKAWGLIKAGIHKQTIAELATDRGNDGAGADAVAKL